ncbi:ABC transporter ATP-binding protein [Geomicrobium sp. JCM 19038]|uniref:ABC transporter ATP-binding protein n=1 Tax=Geomicrobium sp. JCM 19038 TaxID=1460635 RepID=UPI00045F1047|nr:ABC transporter ATP-binding protein [Geomicrobium sp. JCM 19038]GAK06993.1 hypothetical protein JCM19038_710 [Geomicrobium sp. JCM 19038]
MITLENVSFKRDKVILDSINWQVARGEHWAILGMNGAGKTALLNIICGYQFPSSGEVYLFGKQFGQYPWQELRKRIGLVSFSFSEKMHDQLQNYGIEVVLSGLHASIGLHTYPSERQMHKANKILSDLGIDYLERQPYEQMSQGEKQRVLIGRALMAEPEILMLDEPCNGLDFFSKAQLLENVKKLAEEQKTTILYITHQVDEILPAFKSTLLLREGRVFRAGKTEQLLTSEQLSEFCRHPVTIQKENEQYQLKIDEYTK